MKKITNSIKIKVLLALPVLVMFLFASCELKAQDTIWYENGEYEVNLMNLSNKTYNIRNQRKNKVLKELCLLDLLLRQMVL